MPLAALARYSVSLCNGTEQLFTPDEVSLAQPHFDAKVADGLLGFSGERAAPPGLSKFDSRITEHQAQLIGVTMDTAVKLSAFIDGADRRHTAATMASKSDPSGTASELSRSLRLHTAGVNAACGQASLSTLASYRQANGCGERLFSSSEIGRARAWNSLTTNRIELLLHCSQLRATRGRT